MIDVSFAFCIADSINCGDYISVLIENSLVHNLVFLGFSSMTIMQILLAILNGIFRMVGDGWFESKTKYWLESVFL